MSTRLTTPLQLRAVVVTAGLLAFVDRQDADVGGLFLFVRINDPRPFVLSDGPRAHVREEAEENEADNDDCDRDDNECRAERKDDEGGDEGDRVQDVDERREDVAVEVAAQSCPDWRHYRDDWNRYAQIVEGVLRDLAHHETSPVEAHATVEGHEDDGSRCRYLLRDSEQQCEHARRQKTTVLLNNDKRLCKCNITCVL